MKFARMARVLALPPDAQAALLVRDRWSAARRRSWCLVRKMWQCQRVSRSWHAKLRESEASPLAKEEDSETSDENGPPLVPKSARVVFEWHDNEEL